MKTILIPLIFIFSVGTATAELNTEADSTSQSGSGTAPAELNTEADSASQSGAVAIAQGGSGTGSDLSRMVPAVMAPALTTTLTETCMGSTSVGVGWSGAGFSFGTTWRDSACVRRLDARQISSIHPNFAIAAKELMCDSDAVFEAFKRAGLPCAPRDGYEVPVAEPKK